MADSVTVELPDNLTIANVEALHEQLDTYALASQDVVLNASSVERVDTAGLQTLYAFHQALKAHGANMSWADASSVLVEAAQCLGMKEHLALT